jgi:hypothetical protein
MSKLEDVIHTENYGDVEIWSQDEMEYFFQVKMPQEECIDQHNIGMYACTADMRQSQKEKRPKCGKRVYAREGWLMNQPPVEEIE